MRGAEPGGRARCGCILADVGPVELFIRDMSPFFEAVSRDDEHGLVVMVWDDSRKLAVEIAQLDGTDAGPWPDKPPLKVCCSAGTEPGRADGISPLTDRQPHTPDKHWDRYGIDLSPAWNPNVKNKPGAFCRAAIQLLGAKR